MLTNKTALVTGSTSGIGLGIAKVLAKAGCNLVLNGLGDQGAIDALCSELDKASAGKVVFHGADLTKVDQIEDMMAFAAKKFGSVDILVNNAGIQHVSPIEDFDVQRWDLVIALNMTAAFHTMRLALGDMKKNNWGRIINVASVHGQVASVNKSAYVASKHGVLGLTKVCALETAKTDITANSICPGWVRTELVEKQIEQRAKDSGCSIEEAASDLLREKQPSGEFVTPNQLGEAALFLCSDAASQMTGTTITMDGGWTAQ
jgi:3-hydroxybutyrate dehydrogenase